jgi:hypothetical protein
LILVFGHRDLHSKKVLMGNKLLYSGLLTGLALGLIGFVGVALAVAVPVFAKAPILAFILMSVPAFFIGFIALVHGFAVIPARIEITDTALKLAVPGWRVFPIPPVIRLTLRWDELLAVRRRKEVYQLLVLPFPVEVFAIDTVKGMVVMGGRSIPGLQRAVSEIVRRAGLTIRDEGELKLGLIQSLLRGSPPWRGGDDQSS